MVERFFKVIALLSLAGWVLTPRVCAEEKFVKYSEVRDQIAPAPKPDKVSQDGLRALQQEAAFYLYDARTKTEFDREHIVGARLPRAEEYYRQAELFKQQVVREAPNSKQALEAGTRDLARDAVIVTYCNRHCGLSKTLMLDLQSLGFTNVRWLDGGIDDWREKGYPLESENK